METLAVYFVIAEHYRNPMGSSIWTMLEVHKGVWGDVDSIYKTRMLPLSNDGRQVQLYTFLVPPEEPFKELSK